MKFAALVERFATQSKFRKAMVFQISPKPTSKRHSMFVRRENKTKISTCQRENGRRRDTDATYGKIV